MSHIPLQYQGEGQFTAPKSWRRKADETFVVGEVYSVEVFEQRSAKQHARYFAIVNEYWQTLPEELTGRYPSSEHLRKAALCHTGYCSETKIVCANNSEAMKQAALVAMLDRYAIVSIVGNVVTVWIAETQNTKAMDKAKFKASSDAVLTWIEINCLGLNGTSVDTQG